MSDEQRAEDIEAGIKQERSRVAKLVSTLISIAYVQLSKLDDRTALSDMLARAALNYITETMETLSAAVRSGSEGLDIDDDAVVDPEGVEDMLLRSRLAWRNPAIQNVCHLCKGRGGIDYPDSGTWRHRLGGPPFVVLRAITHDVCYACWGSGDADRPWTDLHGMALAQRREVGEATLKDLARAAGVRAKILHPAVEALVQGLERMQGIAKKTITVPKRPAGFREVSRALVGALKAGLREHAKD